MHRVSYNGRMMEDWKQIATHSDYEVSDLGRVRFKGGWRKFGRNARFAPANIRVPQPHSGGYLQLVIRGKNRFIHRLVAEAFVPNPDGLPEVNHKDGDKTNNAAANLEWVSRSANLVHASRVTGVAYTGPRIGRRITRAEREAIRVAGGSYGEIAGRFSVSVTRVLRIKRGLCAAAVEDFRSYL